MNDETGYDRWKGSCTVLMYYPCPYVGALRNTTENLITVFSEDSELKN
jgi:hypothetical protein